MGTAVLLVPLAAVGPAAQAQARAPGLGPAALRPLPPQKPVPVHAVPSHPVRLPANRPWHLPAASWPTAGTATVTVPVTASASVPARVVLARAAGTAGAAAAAAAQSVIRALPSAGSHRAGALPVWVGPGTAVTAAPRAASAGPAAAAAAAVRVSMASRRAAAAAGVSGVIFTVAQSGAAAGSRPVHVSLDYSSFAYADGGDFAARLRLVELPACALTTPDVAACRRQVPLGSSDDVKADRLGADVTLPGGVALPSGARAAAAGAPAAAPAAAAPAVVLAATTGPSGSDGNYTATPLSEAGSWSAGGSAGAFTYSYPITVPPVPAHLAPSVSLDYSSQAVDGLTSSTNNQASWVGDGWDYQPGYIERDYQSCELNPSGSTKTADLCWSPNNTTTLSLGGMTTTLVDDPKTGWHAEADNGYKVTYATGSGSNGTHDDGYWVVTAPDGTSYTFGLSELPGYTSSDKATGSVFTVPVYATASGQPCYNATFSQSHCLQAWRWNLDWVTDPHGDAEAYYYQSETNYYAADNGTKATASYVQGGVPTSIQYGLRSSSGYGTPAAEVTFTSATDRTDVPTGSSNDLACASGAACTVTSPTFWDKYRLTAIATSTLEGSAQTAVDSWALTDEYLSTGSTSAAPLWLEKITRTTGETGNVPLIPPVSFGGTALDNRTATSANLNDGYSMIPRNRITSVTTETGGAITIIYDTPPSSCTSGSFPADDANTLLCYPTYWTPPSAGQREDWFNKYAVSSVTQQNTAGGTTAVVTNYSYSGAAWHYDDDALSRSGNRTWDQWRGFRTVTTELGNAANGDPVTEASSTYFQGMNGDYQGSGNAVTSASLTSQVGNVTVTDHDQYAGMQFEHTVRDGAGGSIVTDTVTTPWTSAATATQSQPSPLPALTAYMTGTAKTQAFNALASGGYREADTSYTHDSDGRVTVTASAPDASDNGSGGDPSGDTCTQTTYTSSSTLLDLPKEVIVTSVAPSACPVSGTPAQSELVSDTQYLYDGATSDSTAPAKGDVTGTEKATSYNSSGAEVFTPQGKATYDEYGRVLTTQSAASVALGTSGKATTIAYTPPTGAEPTSVTATDPMGLGATTTYDPARELPLTVTSPAGWATTETYDALGRLTAVWTPGHVTSGPADETFSYSVSATAPSVITTNTINTAGNYQTSEVLYDSLGRKVETQAETVDGNRDITDTYYQSDGWVQDTSNAYYTTGAPSATLVAAPDNQVPSQTGYAYDGTGRVTRQVAYSLATEKWETDTGYGGDYTTVTPPAGGTATTTYVNGIGKTSYIYQYHSATPPASPPAPGSGSQADSGSTHGWDQTAYTYTPAGLLHTVTDATGKNTWTYGYDLLGNQVSASDPDSGNTTSTYDGNGNLLSVTHAGLKTGSSASTTVSYTYDQDNRKTAEYDTSGGASETASDELAAWTYDTLAAGQPYQSISYTGGTSGTKYTQSVTGYNAYGLPQGDSTQVSAGPWQGTYKETYGYTTYSNQVSDVTYQAAGGLPLEDVTTGYNDGGNPASLGSSLWTYVASLAYTELGQPQEYALGTSNEPSWILNTWDLATGRLDSSEVQAGVSPVTVGNTGYSYDNQGLMTAAADTPSGGPAQVQCFSYDYLGRLTTAWSQGSSGCSSGPSQSAEATAAAPYWDQYGYDLTGNLTSVTSTPATGSAATTSSAFPAPGSTAYQPSGSTTAPSPPHAVTGTGPQNASPTTTEAYDAAGHLTSVTAPGYSQTLSWNDAGQLGSITTTGGSNAGTTSYVYDASGSLLQQTDAAARTATLYLPGETLTKTTSGTITYSSTRYYSIGGVTIAARTSAGTVDYLAGNQQGTDTIAINSASLGATHRYYDPYGSPVGTAPGAWPGTKGFVGGTTDTATGLTNLGAREYDPATASFISPDPLFTPYVPQDLNPYAYSTDDPVTLSDPTGLCPKDVCGGNINEPTSQINVGSGAACPDYYPGCPGFTGGGAGPSGETLYGPGYSAGGYITTSPAPTPGSSGRSSRGTYNSYTCFRFGLSCEGFNPAAVTSTSTSQGSFFVGLWHTAATYYNDSNAGIDWLTKQAYEGIQWSWAHAYLQGTECLVICLSLTLQDGDLIVGGSGWSYAKSTSAPGEPKLTRYNKSMFGGVSMGINAATLNESLQNNVTVGGCYADEIGGCGGITAQATPGKSIGPVRPYAGVVILGGGLQAQAGPSWSWDASQWFNGVVYQLTGW